MPDLRERCIEAMTSAVWPDGKWSAEAECMLDAVLPVLATAIKPHRWDLTYLDSQPEECRVIGPDSFYNGILHASRVVRDLLPPVIPRDSLPADSEPPFRAGDTPDLPSRASADSAPNAPSGNTMRLAYADPPYLGCCRLYDHEHNDGGPAPWDGQCWDDPRTHQLLFDALREYDGWAYSMTSTSLAQLLPLASPCRVAAWVKPFAAFKRNVRIAYTWEPVLFVPGRDSSKLGAPVGRDHIAQSITMRKGFTGTKPPAVCTWVLDLLGYVEGDEVTDLFPGLGVMGDVLAQGRIA